MPKKSESFQFRQIQQRLYKADISLEATDEVLDYLGEQGFDPQFGARPLKHLIIKELSKEIPSGKVSKDAVVEAVLENGEVHFENVELPIV